MMRTNIIALDGHDGAGKTTLAKLLSERLSAQYVRPFGGQWGADLMEAHRRGDDALTVDVGAAAIQNALNNTDPDRLIVLDRSWITVCSLVPCQLFLKKWTIWIPTILCWCDLATTLERLDSRHDEVQESSDYHQHYLAVYKNCALLGPSRVLRTDDKTVEESVIELECIARSALMS